MRLRSAAGTPFGNLAARLAQQVEERARAALLDDAEAFVGVLQTLYPRAARRARRRRGEGHLGEGGRGLVEHVLRGGEEGRARLVRADAPLPDRLDGADGVAVGGERLLSELVGLLRVALLRRPATSSARAVPRCAGHIRSRRLSFSAPLAASLIELDGVVVAALLEGHVAEAGAGGGAEAARLAEVADEGQVALRRLERVVEVCARGGEVGPAVGDAAHADLLRRVDDRLVVDVEAFFDAERAAERGQAISTLFLLEPRPPRSA